VRKFNRSASLQESLWDSWDLGLLSYWLLPCTLLPSDQRALAPPPSLASVRTLLTVRVAVVFQPQPARHSTHNFDKLLAEN